MQLSGDRDVEESHFVGSFPRTYVDVIGADATHANACAALLGSLEATSARAAHRCARGHRFEPMSFALAFAPTLPALRPTTASTPRRGASRLRRRCALCAAPFPLAAGAWRVARQRSAES